MIVYGGSLATTSRHHALIATLIGGSISIYETPRSSSHQAKVAKASHQIPLEPGFAAKVKTITFSPPCSFSEPRILIASINTVHIYSAVPDIPDFHASIINAASPSSALQSATFITADEVILVPELAPRITIRDVTTGLGVEVRDVKHTASIGSLSTRGSNRISSYSIREKSGHIAFLTRPSVGKDVVVLLTPQKSHDDGHGSGIRDVELEFSLPTSDALGLWFSHDGAWIAVLDTATAPSAQGSVKSAGQVYIYTPTGKLYKQWSGPRGMEDAELSLGVERIEWLADGRLAIATMDNQLVILAAKTFEEELIVKHPMTFDNASSQARIYAEQIAADSITRSYTIAALPAAPPTQTNSGSDNLLRGITYLKASMDGSYLASIVDHTPTTVHILSLSENSIQTSSVLIHHAPIKSIEWHPQQPGWLLIQTTQSKPSNTEPVYVWSAALSEPIVLTASIPKAISELLVSTSLSSSSSIGRDSSMSWVIEPQNFGEQAIPNILASFPTGALCFPAIVDSDLEMEETISAIDYNEETPTRQPPLPSHKLTQKTPIRGHGPEDAFDQSFEELKAESLAQSISESVTDGGFSPVKFDATDWTRRQVIGGSGDDQDDTFVGKAKKR